MGQDNHGQASGGDPAAPAGWYPVDGGMQRYWDGRVWTEHLAPPPPPAPPPAGQNPTPRPATPSPSEPSTPSTPSSGTPTPTSGFGPTAEIGGPGPDADRIGGTGSAGTPPPSADAPTPWVGGEPAGDQTAQAQPFAAPQAEPFANQPVESQPFSVPTPGHGAFPGPSDQPVPPAMVSSDDKSMALLLHLLSLVIGFLGPLVIWLSKRDQSPFIDHHGKAALNFQISLFIYWIGTFLAIFLIVGLLIVPVLLVVQILFPILAAVAANRGEYYRYPLAIPFIR